MADGVRVTVEFDSPPGCPVAGLSERAAVANGSVTSSAAGPESGGVTEFSVASDGVDGAGLVPIFSHGDVRRYRIQHDDEAECPCRCLGRLGCPVDRYVPEDGSLTLVFYTSDHREAQQVLEALRARYPGVVVRRVEQSPSEGRCRDEAVVDRGKLTGRQLEVLRTAYEMGYFEYPRRNNATAVAAELGISLSTFGEHLSTAERKLLEDAL